MKVVICPQAGPPDVLVVSEQADPIPASGQVVVRVAFAAITFVETQMRAGRSPRPGGEVVFPIVLGNGVGGEIIGAGPDVDPSWVGKTVVTSTGGTGGYAEQALAAASDLHVVPAGLELAQAVALLADGRTASALARAAVFSADDRVLITAAAGGVGSLLVQMARNAGAAAIVALAGGERKLALAKELGATLAVDYRDPSWADEVRHSLGVTSLGVTSRGGSGLTVAFDGVGGDTTAAIAGLLTHGARFLPHGAASGQFSSIDPTVVGDKEITVISLFSIMGGADDAFALTEHAFAEAAAGRIRPVIGQTFPLERAADAHAAIDARETLGKTLLIV